jgi:hypothetical protein
VATETATEAGTAVATEARTAPLVLLQAGPRAMAVQRAERLHLGVPAPLQVMTVETRR